MIGAAWAAAFATALLAAGDVCNRKVIGWLPDDPPRPGRKQHARPIPLAGVLLAPVMVPWLVAERAWWALAAIALATAVGFADDRGKEHGRDLDWRTKAVGLCLAAAAAATAVVDPVERPGAWLAVAALAFVLTNATNFLDNTDGVAAALAAVGLLAASGGDGAGAAAGFAALAFVPWNWPRPRLFLGDAGAYALGIATAIAVAPRALADPRALLFVAVQLGDFGQVVVARVWLGIRPWIGDRRHVTHIAQNAGLPRVLVAPLFAAIAAALAFAAGASARA
jgi:UDP-N-acetylmuramyl pentapeptide phosphotransferase/UDP-N-acetylglucosamine-1-phosphate transferase